MNKNKPPRLVDRFLEWYCSSVYLEEVQGDLHEWFAKRVARQGLRKARLFYVYDVISYFKIFRLKRINEMEKRNNILFINYLVIAGRQFKKNFWYSSLNAFGLTVGLLSALLISIYILDELSYDRFHQDHEDIYRLVNHSPNSGRKGDATPSPWKANMALEFPEIGEHTRFGQDIVLISEGSQNFLENEFYWADDNFLSFFSFEVLAGDRQTMLTEPNSIVLTRSKAMRYFNDLDVVGRTIPMKVYDGNKDFLMKISGVIEDIPTNSHIQFDFLGSMSTTVEMYGNFEKIWGLNWLKSYVKLSENTDVTALVTKIPDFFEKYRGEGSSEFSDILFQPMSEVRLYSSDVEGKIAKGNLDYIYLFGFVALLILFAASMNYVNLTTAKSSTRGKEVGMRKVLGALKGQIARQFYVECSFQLSIALLMAGGLAILLLPAFNDVVGKEMTALSLLQIPVLLVMGGVCVSILLFSGFYPALVMNRFRPVDVLRGNVIGALGNKSWLRKFQVLVQFSITAFLISSTLIVVSQLRFFNTYDKGFNAAQLINIPVDDRGLQERLMVIKQRMSEVVGVHQITATGEALPSAMNNTWGFDWDGKIDEESGGINAVAIDYDYLQTIETKLVLGRNLSRDLSTDSSTVCLINESAFKKTGWKDIDGRKLKLDGRERLVVGVIEDFHYNSLHSEVAPAVYLLIQPGARVSPDNLVIRLDANNIATSLVALDNIWKEFSDQPFDFTFVDQSFAQLYGNENKFVKVVVGFAIVGVFLTVLGLVGLVSFMAERNSKQISIRKVLGASRQQILSKFTGQFVQIFIIAMLISLPASWLAMDKWLEGFAFKISVSWTIFLSAAAISVVITLLSVGGQALKVASSNPVKYLSNQ